jgi:hypothetical protein
MVTHACNPNTREAEAGELACLSYIGRTCLKKEKKKV